MNRCLPDLFSTAIGLVSRIGCLPAFRASDPDYPAFEAVDLRRETPQQPDIHQESPGTNEKWRRSRPEQANTPDPQSLLNWEGSTVNMKARPSKRFPPPAPPPAPPNTAEPQHCEILCGAPIVQLPHLPRTRLPSLPTHPRWPRQPKNCIYPNSPRKFTSPLRLLRRPPLPGKNTIGKILYRSAKMSSWKKKMALRK